jgi:hypothetical protein
VGTILVKNFYYPADFAKPKEQWRIIETRILLREADSWVPLCYVWEEDQTEAYSLRHFCASAQTRPQRSKGGAAGQKHL